MQQDTIPTPVELINHSSASEEFKKAFQQFLSDYQPSKRIQFGFGNPPVKVLRAICGLLEAHPDLEIQNLNIDGRSGCSDYRGHLVINEGEHRFTFVWDCAWKAREEGLTDFMGFPDQAKAAQVFGHRCFEKFEKIA